MQRLFSLMLCSVMLIGCGQSGALYLPKDQPQNITPEQNNQTEQPVLDS